ncbi:MAG: CBS domain-containing protein [Actinobacteria bacterium]|nr:CBS domain-containing protein [Actinomycetota bacterium]
MRADEVIATHGNTDFDAFAAMLAARRLYPSAVVAIGSLNRNVRDFYRLHADELGPIVESGRLEGAAIRRLVVVETMHASRLGDLEKVALDPAVEKVLFDHHRLDLPDWVEPDAAVLSTDGALTTTLVGILAERELEPTMLEATVFALGIHEDTGSLTHPTTTQRDVDALAWCLRHGARQDLISEYLHSPLGADERALLNHLVEALEPVQAAGGDEVLVAAVRWPEYVEGISNLASKIVDLTDTRALVLLVEMDERVFAVVRSRSDRIDATIVATALGGGGHAQAASAIARGSLDEARHLVLEALARAEPEAQRAREVMSTPARVVTPDESVREAMVLCQRHGQSGVFVAENGRVVGAVSREDLDKAIGHDLAHAPVRGIMSGSVATASEQATLAELQSLVTTAADGRVAVVRDDELVGVVTRADLLRALEGVEPEQVEPAESIAAELMEIERLRPVIDAVAALGERPENVFLVGGTVRDILLGEESFDVDIAVEGDAIAFAGALAGALGGRMTPHQKFGTAVVQYGGGRVDVVTTRTEFYDAPGALPTVERAGLREDLFRRDFTVNAMAASLKAADFGRLEDPFRGRDDLDARVLRVLHNLSFIDDPTRIFRAIRYEARYGLQLEEHSARLARGTIEMGLVGDLSSARLRDELIALLEDPGAAGAILRLGELGADRAIHPHLRADAEAAALFERALSLRAELSVDVPGWHFGVAALARDMTSDEAYDWLDRLKVRRREVDRIVGAIRVAPLIVERVRAEPLDAAQIVALADTFAPDAPLLALARADLPELREYFSRLRDVRLEIGGQDLARLGLSESPRVGEVLAELRRRKLNGEIDGRESELEAARELMAADS